MFLVHQVVGLLPVFTQTAISAGSSLLAARRLKVVRGTLWSLEVFGVQFFYFGHLRLPLSWILERK